MVSCKQYYLQEDVINSPRSPRKPLATPLYRSPKLRERRFSEESVNGTLPNARAVGRGLKSRKADASHVILLLINTPRRVQNSK